MIIVIMVESPVALLHMPLVAPPHTAPSNDGQLGIRL